MKNILITLAAIIALSSCNKEHRFKCTVYRSYYSTPNASPVSDSIYYTTGTKDEINKHSQEMRRDSGFINTQGIPDTLQTRVSCQKERKEWDERLVPDIDLSFN